ncbi:T9SS type A sorting domain-containing protein [Flavobacterium wongokense]|uniref:T9SS type A sorting domain-containing protein n=1 Tax=Flavobacterium wongokense TaxID=2910674 RepID=UPI001F15AD40|nr:T9SS type A sorting domain-containing protein [Flavobacterium sp. WG47]MCF6132532.1 T9SS type A sorting domain-containing protein [Flavobacterium sp. WG47]
MNKLYISLLLLISYCSFAQDSRIFGQDWYLTDLNYDGTHYPPPRGNLGVRFESGTQEMTAWACYSMYGQITFANNETEFSGTNFSPCLCWCTDSVLQAYEDIYFYLFMEGDGTNDFTYVITELGDNQKSLVINSAYNKQAIYSTVHMATADFNKPDFSIAPNPAADWIEITLENQTEGTSRIEFYDSLGKICKAEQSNSFQFKMDTRDLSQGLYFVKINNGNSTVTKKFVKL